LKKEFMKFYFLVLALAFSGCASTHPTSRGVDTSDHGAVTEQMMSIPVTEADGNVRAIQTRLCEPVGKGPYRLVVINHGSPPSASDRPTVVGYKCDSEPVRWFLSRGYAVASPIRRGYGATGGIWSENYGKCENADFVHAGLETARDIQAAVDFLVLRSEIQSHHVVIVGQSAGGWGTIAYNSLPHANISAVVNMAGGRGGHKDGINNNNCSPDKLIQSAGEFGKTASTAMLWFYAENDSFFSSELAQSMHDSFVRSGGKARLIQEPSFGNDGHSEFGGKGGSKIWGPDVEEYLARTL